MVAKIETNASALHAGQILSALIHFVDNKFSSTIVDKKSSSTIVDKKMSSTIVPQQF